MLDRKDDPRALRAVEHCRAADDEPAADRCLENERLRRELAIRGHITRMVGDDMVALYTDKRITPGEPTTLERRFMDAVRAAYVEVFGC